ncbi:MAG: SUMF1/EgtB/PvdO family nonheme iron enzyme [Deltaproteobacteria bacterium]
MVDAFDGRTAPTRSQCAPGMLLVDGEYCPQVDQQCLRWLDLDEEFPMRCAEFAPTRCISQRRHVSVCMDEFEYPNHQGAFPQVMVSWYAARRACEARGARLCSMAEWTFACEGEQMLPYPYGLQRDDTACNFDHQSMRPDRPRLGNPATAADESARLYEAVPSGQYARCVSPTGIHDMTGNADEWVTNETGRPFQSALKGGWWGPIRGRCRPATVSHNEGFVYYQIGFRCCADPT